MRDDLDDLVRRTTTDAVYETLHDEIVSLKLLPGARLSESEVARRFNVSRQPVRNAFTRLDNNGLLLIRPQKATVVRGFSMERISLSRLVRLSLELEVVHRAIQVWDADKTAKLSDSLALQEQAIDRNDLPTFHDLDYDFHKLIFELSGNPTAFEIAQDSKQKVDRLCLLSLGKHTEAKSIFADHTAIVDGLASGSLKKAQAAVRKHLSRLDETIAFIYRSHPNYFE